MFDVNVEPAWGATLGEGVTALVVDYPVDYRHEDLRDNMDPADSPGLTEAAVVGSDTSHGTSMASIIAARDNAVGFRGVAPRAALTWRSINSVEIHSYLAVDDANTWSTCVEVVDADGSVAGAWVPGCESYRGAPAPAQYYTFTLDSESQVTIELQSSSGSNLYVRNGYALSGGWIAHDYGFKRNSRVSRTLPAGVYTIEATTYLAERSTGSFTLQVAGLDGVSVPDAIESGRRWAPVWDSLLEAAVVNRSYGPANYTRPYKDESGGLGHLPEYEVYDTMAEFGFDGRGTLNVVSGGKTFPVPGLVFWATLAEERSHPAVVAACATDRNGRRDARSNTSIEGPNLWVCAPVGGMVYAILGDRYYLSTGTPSSPATALVSGVAALVRSIDASLSWRDVKLILAASAQHNDPGDAGWQQGAAVYGAAQQNYRYHHSYGFGVVDAGAAVQLAQNWRYLPEYRSEHISAPMLSPAPAVPDDGSTVAADLAVDPEIDFVEYVEAHLVLDAPWFRDLEVELESPSGTVSTLSVPVGDITNPALAKYDCKQASECGISGSFRFGTAAHLGEDPAGTWTLRLADRRPNGGANTLESWSLRFFGHKSSDPTPNLTPSPTFGPWPQVSIAAGADITEGDDVTFTITADPAPSEALDVTLSVTAAGDFGVSPGSRQVTVPTTGTATLTVSTTGDSADEADGSVTATVVSGSGYSVSQSAGSASVAVADDDVAPCDTATAISRARAAFVWHTDNDGGNEVWFWQILAYLGADPMPARPGGGVLASTTPEAVRAFSDGKTWSGWAPINAAMSCHTPPPVVSIAAGADVGEGGDATFTVSAVPAPSAALDVTVGVAQIGDFGVPAGSHTVTVPVSGSATFAVATTDDSADEVDGSVTVTVAAGSGYTVSAAAGTAAVAVTDDDVPKVSIAAGARVTEGGDATFAVSVVPVPFSPLTVGVTVSQSGDFGVLPGSYTVTVPTTGSATLAVSTTGDSADEADGSVTATVVSGSGYSVSQSAGSASVAVADDDDEVRVADRCVGALSGDGSVSGVWAAGCGSSARAGRLARFLSFSLDSPSRVTVNLKSSADTYLYLRRGVGQRSGAALASDDDGGSGYNSRISRQLAAGGYTIEATTYHSSTGGSFTLTVAGIGTQTVVPPDPVVSIAAGGGVTEGSDATFTVTADPVPSAALDVTVAVTAAGDFGVSPGSHTVTVPSSGSATLTVATVGDSVDEADGSVTATVSAGSGYTVSATAGAASVAVADDDVPPPTVCVPSLPSDAVTVSEVTGWRGELSHAAHRQRWDRVLAALGVDTGETAMTVADAQAVKARIDNARWDRTVRTLQAMAQCDSDPPPAAVPEVSITAGGGVTEGGDATFTIIADPAPTAPLTVNVAVAQSGDFGVMTGSQSVTVPTSGSATLTVATTNDSTDEADGSATVTINGGTGYTVSSAAGTASVGVADDDDPPPPPPAVDPVVSVTAVGGVTEGSDATFTVTAVPVLSSPLTVTVTVSQSGDFGVTTGSQSVTIPTSGSATFTAATTNDSADEADGSVTVTINGGTGYTVSQSAGTASVAVADDDDPPPPPAVDPVVSVTAGGGVTEGGDATFTVTADPAPSAALAVEVTIAQTGDHGVAAGTRQVTIPTSGTVTLTVATVNDSTDEADGTVTATVGSGSGYTVSTASGSATVAVADDDDPPLNATPSLSISDASAGEGGTLTFTVTLSPASGRYVWVHYYARPAFGAALSATFADFAQAYGMLTFSPGETTKTITVAAVDDSSPEDDETFRVVLYSAAQAAVADGEGIGTITDND
ncbi:proprotein convertase P-domain-containing protein [Candidatus Poriferisodalis sp.]|uniref:proprotein convertase P-domain-containing protein n=1 Tax=Candidatus Poriferisodalis sp. TaxID=3101277 RepID=UPI003B5C8C33